MHADLQLLGGLRSGRGDETVSAVLPGGCGYQLKSVDDLGRLVLRGAAEVVGFTITEFIPRQLIHLQHILEGFPLIS
jgi:hypothetical protein